MVSGGYLRIDELFPLANCSLRGTSLPCPTRGTNNDSPMLVRRWHDYMQYRVDRVKFKRVYQGAGLHEATRAVEAAVENAVLGETTPDVPACVLAIISKAI